MFAELPLVPELCSSRPCGTGITLGDWLNGRTVQEASTKASCLAHMTLSEGIVIRPWREEKYVDFGDGRPQRLIIKQRSPEYLAKEK